MTEQMIVEAVRSAQPGARGEELGVAGGPRFVAAVPDPSAVQRFSAAMEVPPVSTTPNFSLLTPHDSPIPFASEATAAWRSAQANNQGILHRIRALCDLKATHSPSAGNLVELQYEVMNLAFQQEVVTKVADKASTAIQTLVKNQ